MITHRPLPLTLSILTWKAPKTLENTLASLEPIKGVFAERLVICQESDPAEITIAEAHGFTAIKLKENVGLQNGVVECVKHAQHAHVLVMENDIPWIVSKERERDFRMNCEYFLKSDLKLCRFDRLDSPRKRYARYWGKTFPVRRRLAGMLRPSEANAIRAEIVGFENFSHDQSMDPFLKKVTDNFYITDSSSIFWNVRAVLVSRKFFIGTIIAYAESVRPRRLINKYPDLESTMNCPMNRHWWRSQRFPIGLCAPGYFGHVRYDRCESDEKRIAGGALAEG